MGRGDGVTTYFSYNLRGPVVPGSVVVFIGLEGAVDRLADLTQMPRSDPDQPTLADTLKDGNLIGQTMTGSSVTYDWPSAYLTVQFDTAPYAERIIYVRWLRKQHEEHGAQVPIVGRDGEQRLVSLERLKVMLDLA